MNSGGGLAYRTDAELLWSIRRLVHDDELHDELSHAGFARRINEWSEAAHLDRYFELIATIRAGRAGQGPHRPPASVPSLPEGTVMGRQMAEG